MTDPHPPVGDRRPFASRLLLVLVSALLVAPAATAYFAAVDGRVTTDDGTAASGGAVVEGPRYGAAPREAERPPERPLLGGEPRPAEDRPTIQPYPCCGNASFDLAFAETHLRLRAGERTSVPFAVRNTGSEPIHVALRPQGSEHVRFHVDPDAFRLRAGESARGVAFLGAAPDAPEHAADVVLYAKGHLLTEECREVRTQNASCDAGTRAARLHVKVVREDGQGGVRFGIDPSHQRVEPGGGAMFHVLAWNGGNESVTLALRAGMRAPEGWAFELGSDKLTLAPGEKGAVRLLVRAPEGAWTGERALVHVHAKDDTGRTWLARAFAEALEGPRTQG